MQGRSERKWWDKAVGYIIYPQSFCDSNNDGIGDIKGIISKLDYLSSLGVDLLWICPLFDSPMDDNGYDVRDYLKVNPLYGSNEDLDLLLVEAHKRGIRILLDLVLNHTSDEHPWFKKALSEPNSKERDYYYIRKGKRDGLRLMPPNNWKSFFGGSAWERIGDSEDFYLHIFSKKMPDVNWSNPALREQYHLIAKHYLDKGFDGFRLDAVAHLAKDLSFEDSTSNIDEYGLAYDPSRFSNREELYGYLEEFNEKVFSHYDCLIVGEAGGGISPEQALRLANYENGSINMVFHFDTVWNNGAFGSIDKKDEDISTEVITLKDNFMRWYNLFENRGDLPIYWTNHDHPRALSQYGSTKFRKESAKMLITTLLFFYGTPFILNGDEIGMSNCDYSSLEDFYSDVSSKQEILALLEKGYPKEQILSYMNRTSRVNGRTPMLWDNSPNGGFSISSPINKAISCYKEGVNVKEEEDDPDSILQFYRYAIYKRKDPYINEQIKRGHLELLDHNHPDVIAYIHEGSERLIVISSFRPYTVYFSFYFRILDVVLHNYPDVILEDHVFTLRPFESYVLKVAY